MTVKQQKIREEMEYAERKANFFFMEHQATYHQTWSLTMWGMYGHYTVRRRYFLRQLLKMQLKEFSRE